MCSVEVGVGSLVATLGSSECGVRVLVLALLALLLLGVGHRPLALGVLADGREQHVLVDDVVRERVDLLVFAARHAHAEVPDANLTLTVATDELVVEHLQDTR